MADDIYGNMSNMSVDELGSSLLQKKAESDKAAAKKAKKNERIQQGLALLLMGQGVMKTQFKKRMKELDDFHKFETIGNDNKAKQLNMNSTILNTIGNTWDGKGGYDGFKNSEDYLGFKQAVRPYLIQKLKASSGDEYDTLENTSTFDNAIELGTEGFAKKYLAIDPVSKKANYLAYQDGIEDLLGDDAINMDKNELFQTAMGLSANELTTYQRRNYQKVLAEYKAQGNIVGGFKRVLGLFNDDYKRKGGFDIFSKVTEDALAGPTIRDLNQAMNLKGMTNNIVSKALADASKSPTRWKERASGKRFENYRKNISDVYLPQMTNLIEEGRYPSELGSDSFINKKNWEEFMADISDEDRRNLVTDTAALSLRLKEDRKFLTAVYNETEGKKEDGKSFNEFRAILDDEANRTMFAATIVTDAGFRDESWLPYKQETYNSFGTLTQVYNKYNMSTMVGDDIKVNDRGGLDLPESYIDASKDRKKDMIEATVKDILKNSKTENERNIKLGGALDIEINKYFGMDSQAYIENLAAKEMKGVETPVSLEQEIQQKISELPEESAFMEGIRPILPSREERVKRNIETREESKQSKLTQETYNEVEEAVDTLFTGGLGSIFTNTKTELKENEVKKEESEKIKKYFKDKYDININPVASPDIIKLRKTLQEQPQIANEILNIVEDYNQDKTFIPPKIEDEKKKTKLSPNYENPEYNKLLDLHFNRLGIDSKELATRDLNELSDFILEVESDGDFNAANPNSSARGGYQFIKGSVVPAVNRLEKYLGPLPRFDEVRKTGDVRSLSSADQTLLFMGDILEKRGSDKLINKFLNADNKKDKQNAAYEIYTVLHHTTDKEGKIPFRAKLQTKFKLRKYFNE